MLRQKPLDPFPSQDYPLHRPSSRAAKMTYASTFDFDFASILRNFKFATLADIKNDAENLEANMITLGKLKLKIHSDDKIKVRYQVREKIIPSKSANDKINEMTKLIKD